MRKRERENPCGICGHYHKYEEGEVCGICGHRMPAGQDKTTAPLPSAFSSEILPEFLYLGSYDNASRAELLKTQGISRVLNTVPRCQNMYKNSFTYHCLPEDQSLPFDDAIQYLEQCGRENARVLVHCMSGKSRSPAIVIAFLMKTKAWRFAQSYQWVKDRRPSVELSQAVYQQLLEFEMKIFGSVENASSSLPSFTPGVPPPFSFGFPKPNDPVISPAFSTTGSPSMFTSAAFNSAPQNFTFGAEQTQRNAPDGLFNTQLPGTNNNDIPMG